MTTRSSVGLCFGLALTAATTLHFTATAQQGQGQAQTQTGRGQGAPGAGGAPTPAPPPDTVAASASSLVSHPEFYLGKVVTITGSVERQISATILTVGQNGSAAMGEVLVIAPALVTKPAPHAYITVVGDAFAFEPAEAAKRLKGPAPDLPAAVLDQFRGKPAIIATAIVGSDFSDLTKQKPAPMSPDDEKLSPIMKAIQPAAAALRAAATASDATAARAKAAELRKLFTDAQAVFKARAFADAVNWSTDAIKAADAADAAAATARWTDVTAAATTLQGTCAPCHTAHRARQDDGTFRIK